MPFNGVLFGLIFIFIHSTVINSNPNILGGDKHGPFIPKIPKVDHEQRDVVYTGGPATKPPISFGPILETEPTTEGPSPTTITLIIGPLCLSREALERCKGDPCNSANCPAYPNAKCRPNFCSGACKAEFYQDLSFIDDCNLVKKPSPCPPGVPIVNCFVDPCKFAKCPAYPKALCQSNYCGGCNADFYLAGKKVNCDVAITLPTSPCPPGVPLVNCLVDPCTVSKCPAFPNALCHSNYCGGCNADFYLNGQIVNCNVKPPKPIPCPPGVPIVKCFVDPCKFAKCPAHPQALCQSNYCGGCNADFYLAGKKVDCDLGITISPCPPGVPLVNCLVDPCTVTKCPAFPNALCHSNYCGGCNADFYVKDQIVNCNLKPPKPIPCPPGVPIFNCFVDPCQFAKCPAYPKALCQSNYCGGCNADFYHSGKKVNCNDTIPPPTSSPCPPGVPLVNCLVDPCTVCKCPAFPNALCHSNYCGGCNADFYVNDQIVNCNIGPPKPKQKCPPGVPFVNCLIDPCTVSKCRTHPKAICKANYCGGCKAEYFIKKKKVNCGPVITTPKPKPLCPPGVPIFNCLVDPCLLAKCPAFPKAICRSNYCGGCFADYYDGSKKVNCKLPPLPTPKPKSPCLPGVPLVKCLIDPCLQATCPLYPKAICHVNYCGGCNADFYVGKQKVECESDTTIATTLDPDLPCPPGTPIFDCARDPCTMAECPAHPDAICKPNFCTGCRAFFYVNGIRVDCTTPAPGEGCPPGVPLVLCKADPCTVNKCPLHPKAICKANYCGGCFAEYYVHGKRVKCEKDDHHGTMNHYVIY